MKISFWDILSILALLGACLFLVVVAAIFNNPTMGLNPWPPPALPATLFAPTEEPSPFVLPPTWTPTPLLTQTAGGEVAATSTPAITNTLFVVPTFTTTFTPTSTPTHTATPTNTPTPTKTRTWTPPATYTPLPTYTQLPTYTKLPTYTPLPSFTATNATQAP
jgi:hypothetical protein